ncbi:MAG: CHAT domain-containing protein [Symploca sp. SIO3E6]|nr:CHAT domain-containing protein [Caldora sp. SIO3E6]
MAQVSQEQLQSEAQSLTNQGHEQLALGKAEKALKIWQQATEIYQQLRDTEGITGSQINQSLAWQALGSHRTACRILLSAANLDYEDNLLCKQPSETALTRDERRNTLKKALKQPTDAPIRVLTWRTLGDVLGLIGNLNESELILQESLAMAKRLNSPPDISANWLSLGNTKRSLYKRQQDLFERTDLSSYRDKAIESAESSLELYQKSAQLSSSTTTNTEAQLNHLSLLVEFATWIEDISQGKDNPEVSNKLDNIQPQIQPLLDEVLYDQTLFANLPSIPTIYAHLNLALTLIKLDKLPIALQQTEIALQQAKTIEHKRAETYAFGILGNLYELLNQELLAQTCTEKALSIARSVQAWDIAYQWEQQLGRIYEKNGNIEQALTFYDSAVKTLELVRSDLLSVNREVQFSFRENIKPVYEEYINLLLQSASQDNLKKATEVIGQLQLAEVQNFLRCALLLSSRKNNLSEEQDLISLNNIEKLPDAIINIIVLKKWNKVATIVSLPQASSQLVYHYSVARWDKVEPRVNTIRNILQLRDLKPQTMDTILPQGRELYQLLIADIKNYLPQQGTLVFVLDSELQNIPMALLQDEEKHYFIEKYSMAQVPGSRVREPKALPPEQLKVLIAGVSQCPSFSPEFRELTNVERELELVAKNTSDSQKLFNEDFQKQSFQNQISTSTFPIVHLATHGKFSSDPEQTVILACDQRINVWQLDRLLRSRTEISLDTIELLVLSACQTAKGDKQSGLGLAGIALQAGARSTLASLWNVSDSSAPEFMSEFYQGLKNGSKAEALRRAQIAFLKNPKYKRFENPYYWAPFILVGSWL